MGNGLERAYSKNNFINSGYNIIELSYGEELVDMKYNLFNDTLQITEKHIFH